MVTTCIKDGGTGTSKNWSTDGPTKETQTAGKRFQTEASIPLGVCVRACVCAVCMCVRVCVRVCARVCVCVKMTAVLFSTVTLTLNISLWFQLSDPFSDSWSSYDLEQVTDDPSASFLLP